MIGDCDEAWVVLNSAFVHQEIIVAAAGVFAWVLAAGFWPRMINRAAALFCIKELTNAAEVFVGFAAHNVFMAVCLAGIALARAFERQLEMLGEAFDVTLVERNHRV